MARNGGRAGAAGAGLLLISISGPAAAEFFFDPYLTAQNEYHSNLFAQPDDPAASQYPAEDNIRRGIAGLETGFDGGEQKFRITGEGRRVDFRTFDMLNHDEYKAGASLDWKMLQSVDGDLKVEQERRMAAFADRNSSELAMETDRSGHAGINLAVTPAWRLEFGGRGRQLESPLPDFPEFGLREVGASVAAKYTSESLFTAGLFGEQARGHFDGVDGGSRYRINTVQLTSHYAPGGPSSFDALLGYSVLRAEDDPDLEDVAGVTGSIGYRREFSPLTSLSLQGFRRVNSYIAGANATTDIGGSAEINWNPSLSLSLSAAYSWTRNLFDALATEGAVEPGRRDQRQDATGKFSYKFLHWLTLGGYAIYRDRESNVAIEQFRETILGIDLTARWD